MKFKRSSDGCSAGQRFSAKQSAGVMIFQIRAPLKRMKKANRTVYYALKYGAIVAALAVFLFAGTSLR